MYYDLGFNEWIFEIEQSSGKQISDKLREIRGNYDQAKRKVASVMKKIDRIYDKRTGYLKDEINIYT